MLVILQPAINSPYPNDSAFGVDASETPGVPDLWIAPPETPAYTPIRMRSIDHLLGELPVVLRALSDPSRLRLLNLMNEGKACVCHLCEVLQMVQPKVSRHLAYLKRAGLVTARREGQWTHYRWAEHPSLQVRATMDGLRDWMSKDVFLTAERQALRKVRC